MINKLSQIVPLEEYGLFTCHLCHYSTVPKLLFFGSL